MYNIVRMPFDCKDVDINVKRNIITLLISNALIYVLRPSQIYQEMIY